MISTVGSGVGSGSGGRFVLGYIKGSKSVHHKGPKVYWHIKVSHGKKEFEFHRLEQGKDGSFLPKLRVYQADDYPPELIKKMVEVNYIVFL